MSAEAVVRDSIIEVKDEDGSDTSSSGEVRCNNHICEEQLIISAMKN